MAIVNKFNVNKEQVTLDADIIENMSANDVSYNTSTQYDENTVGEKLSELEHIISKISGSLCISKKINSFVNGLYRDNGNFYPSGVYKTYVYDVTPNEIIRVIYDSEFETEKFTAVSLWIDDIFISSILSSPTYGTKDLKFIVPSGVNKLKVSIQSYGVYTLNDNFSIDSNKNDDMLSNGLFFLEKAQGTEIIGLFKSDGTPYKSSFKSYEYSVNKGDIVYIKLPYFETIDFSVISMWNNTKFFKSVLNTPTNDYDHITFVIPDGVNKIISSISNNVYIVNGSNIIDNNSLLKSLINGVSFNDIEEFYNSFTNSLYLDDGTPYSSNYFKTYFYDVEPGEIIKVDYNSDFETQGFTAVSLWSSTTFVKSILSSPVKENHILQFVVPNGVNKLAVSIQNNGVFRPATNKRKKIKALFIGNSVNQDHIGYLPWLLKNTYPELDFEIYICYIGGCTISEYVRDVITGKKNIEIFSFAKNTETWTNNMNIPFDDIFNYGPFDLISYQGFFWDTDKSGQRPDEDSDNFITFINYIKEKHVSPFKLGYLINQVYDTNTHTAANLWITTINGTKDAIVKTPVDIIFPCGVVTKLVLSDFGTSFLTQDNVHNNQGLPCIMGSYVVMKQLADYLGLPERILNNQLRINQNIETELKIPGANGTLQIGTETQYKTAQDAAIQSTKYGNWLLLDSSKNLL